jgi:hypothetical protein
VLCIFLDIQHSSTCGYFVSIYETYSTNQSYSYVYFAYGQIDKYVVTVRHSKSVKLQCNYRERSPRFVKTPEPFG